MKSSATFTVSPGLHCNMHPLTPTARRLTSTASTHGRPIFLSANPKGPGPKLANIHVHRWQRVTLAHLREETHRNPVSPRAAPGLPSHHDLALGSFSGTGNKAMSPLLQRSPEEMFLPVMPVKAVDPKSVLERGAEEGLGLQSLLAPPHQSQSSHKQHCTAECAVTSHPRDNITRACASLQSCHMYGETARLHLDDVEKVA